jgi:hypothetical protein
MGTILEHLHLLRDVDGVYGSFVLAECGSPVGLDLPDGYDHALLASVGPRIARMFEAFASEGRDVETFMLRYADYKLFVRHMTWGLVGVLVASTVNLPALRLAVNLVVRRIDPDVWSSPRPGAVSQDPA